MFANYSTAAVNKKVIKNNTNLKQIKITGGIKGVNKTGHALKTAIPPNNIRKNLNLFVNPNKTTNNNNQNKTYKKPYEKPYEKTHVKTHVKTHENPTLNHSIPIQNNTPSPTQSLQNTLLHPFSQIVLLLTLEHWISKTTFLLLLYIF